MIFWRFKDRSGGDESLEGVYAIWRTLLEREFVASETTESENLNLIRNKNPKTLTMNEHFVDYISGYHCQI
jgi:hypothetical protein